jgi:hypothetical protein
MNNTMKFKFRESPLPMANFKSYIEGKDLERTDRLEPDCEITLETVESEEIKVRDYLFDETTEKYTANYNGMVIIFEYNQIKNYTKLRLPTKPPKSLEGI